MRSAVLPNSSLAGRKSDGLLAAQEHLPQQRGAITRNVQQRRDSRQKMR
jgi:hypothetical protein